MPNPISARFQGKKIFVILAKRTRGCVPILVRVRQEELYHFIENDLLHDRIWPPREMRYRDLSIEKYRGNKEFLQEAEDEYIYRLARRITQENYLDHQQKKVAVLSCGKNSGCWKSDGAHIHGNSLKHL